jgi:hypothetical protein
MRGSPTRSAEHGGLNPCHGAELAPGGFRPADPDEIHTPGIPLAALLPSPDSFGSLKTSLAF